MIHYISYFLNEDEITDRKLEVAGQSKIKYIINSIKKTGHIVNVVSTALVERNKEFSNGKSIIIDAHENHIYLSALGSKSKIISKFKNLYMQIQLLFYLINKVKKGDIIIAYHSLSYIWVLKLFKIIKKNKFILEFNDLYALHFSEIKVSNRIRKKEQAFVNIADGYILASPYMIELLDKNKPYIISYGSYKTNSCKQKYIDNGKINVAYTGVIENLRSAAKLVANSACFLSKDYVVHIAGYGTLDNLTEFEKLCKNINHEMGYNAIEYYGLLLGDKFSNLLNKCQISVNAHTYSKEDLWKSKYSFPSKIPLYMSYGLYLVSYKMDIITESPFSEFTTFFSEFTPNALANAIVTCSKKIKNRDNKFERTPKNVIQELDTEFVKKIKELLN